MVNLPVAYISYIFFTGEKLPTKQPPICSVYYRQDYTRSSYNYSLKLQISIVS